MIFRILAKIKENAKRRMLGDWLDTPEGIRHQKVGQFVYDLLDDASCNVHKKKIVLGDGRHLTISETAAWLATKNEYLEMEVRPHILSWLEEGCHPDECGIDDVQELAEILVGKWVKEERKPGK